LGKGLGWGIVVLTLILRIILILPSQKGMKQQRRMQLIQPKLAEIKEKHKGDQQRVAQETMALWKEHKVNPFGSCLPLLIQFPILIALFYVIKDGLNPDNIHHLYESLKNIELSELHTNFLGILELTKRNIFWLPLLVGGLQFVQMKLTIGKKKGKEPKKKSEMEAANKVMIYFMPVMIAVFAASLPAGVGLYWGTSTLVGIGQQFFVNKEVDSAGKNEPKVRIKDVKEKN
ncbi:YidC/Oxa1 family membrane protein insertase, partial [Patescibacteria group bacterium]|nr:YidC/Oxa1 family membrane protein insertase [Patescibacteria group bacterium]